MSHGRKGDGGRIHACQLLPATHANFFLVRAYMGTDASCPLVITCLPRLDPAYPVYALAITTQNQHILSIHCG